MNPYKLNDGDKVVINTKQGDGLAGRVVETTRTIVMLVEAHSFRGPRGVQDKLDGEVRVHVDNIAWVQVV